MIKHGIVVLNKNPKEEIIFREAIPKGTIFIDIVKDIIAVKILREI